MSDQHAEGWIADDRGRNTTDLVRRPGGDAEIARIFPAETKGGESPLRVLRGRYRWAVGIGVLLAAAGVYAGTTLPEPLYRSVGLIDVAPKVPRVLYESDEKGLLPMFDAYVASEAALASTRRIVDMAMASPAWAKFGRGTSDEQIAEFRQQLTVTHPKYTQHVEVAFSDRDPDAAMTAVNEVIAAYMKVVGEREDVSDASTRRVLENMRLAANSRLTELRSSVLAVTDDFGEAAIDARYQSGIGHLDSLDSALHTLDMEIAGARAANESVRPGPSRELTEQEIALRDPVLDSMLVQRAKMEDRVSYLVNHDKLGARNAELVAARQDVETAQRRVADRVAAFRAAAVPMADTSAAELAQKVERRTRLAELREGVREETRRLGKKLMQLGNLEQERRVQSESRDEVKKRLEQIDVEGGVHGRISVIAYGDRPVEAETDRRVPFAFLGAGGGVALGFGMVLLWGLRGAKLRYVVDVDGDSGGGRFLGVVPDVTDRQARDMEAAPADMGDFCVHHIRTMLQIRAGRRQSVVAFTSSSAGAGKTTLALALGTSFAATGARTLVVDCDFIGHGMTTAMRSIVCAEAIAALAETARVPGTGADADAASVHGTETGASAADGPGGAAPPPPSARRRIVLSLVESRGPAIGDEKVEDLICAAMGRVAAGDSAFEWRVRALDALAHRRNGADAPAHRLRGVAGVMAGRALRECVAATGVANLTILPVGDALPASAERLSQGGIDRMVAAAREEYDVILIDSGPVLGSIESVFATTAADSVVVVVSRGDPRPLVEQTLARLARIGAEVAGVVFNRASSADVARSSYASRSTSRAAVA